jgi:quinoprotein glucose dehydrogenase
VTDEAPKLIFRLFALTAALTAAWAGDGEWPVNGGPYNIRFSPLTQVNRSNVSKLKVAWTYDSHDAFQGS